MAIMPKENLFFTLLSLKKLRRVRLIMGKLNIINSMGTSFLGAVSDSPAMSKTKQNTNQQRLMNETDTIKTKFVFFMA